MGLPFAPMVDLLVVSDSAVVRNEVLAALASAGTTVRELTRGAEVLPAVAEREPDLVVLDMQIGKMGGVAACLELRLEEGAGRMGHVPVLILLDRRADVFLARRSGADGWVLKPLDPMRLERAALALMAGGTYGDSDHEPVTVPL